jgi:DNA-binding CsgD family transcriptional regulator/tetratricopeptide (TPR) repeat protein
VERLVGRERESQALRDFLSELSVRGVALLLLGSTGVGKSVLLAAATHEGETQGAQVTTVGAIRAEMSLPFAGLHQILRRILGSAKGLSQPYRQILLASFGMDNPANRDTGAIAVATLELFAEVAKQAPLLIVVDDAHWLDRESATVLGYVARRLSPDLVALLMAAQPGYATDLLNFGIPELYIGDLDEDSSASLLAHAAPGLSPELEAAVLDGAAGNPLALVELAATAQSGMPIFGPGDQLVTTSRLQSAFAQPYLDLPPPTQLLLLLSCLDEEAVLDEIVTAAAVIDDGRDATPDDLTPAVDSRLVNLRNSRLHFQHPLTRTAIYQASSDSRRRRAHAALASVRTTSPYRRAWHQAASILTPDDAIANELEAAAVNPVSRSRPSLRLAALERAAELSIEPGVRQRRLLGVAELALDFGQRHHANRLLPDIVQGVSSPLNDARVRLVRDLLEVGLVRDPQTLDSLIEVSILAASSGERDIGLRLLRAAAERCWWSGLGPDVRGRISAASHHISTEREDPALLAILAMAGNEDSGQIVRRVADRTPPSAWDAEAAFSLGTALHYFGMFDRSAAFLDEAIPALGLKAHVWPLPEALALQAWNGIYVRDLSTATATAEEAVHVARTLRQPLWEAMGTNTLAIIHALRGSMADAVSFLADAERIAVPVRARALLADTQFAHAIVALSAGSYQEAFEHLDGVFDAHDPTYHYQRSPWRIGDLAEAAVQAGRVDEARRHLRSVHTTGSKQMAPSLIELAVLYAHALLAYDDEGGRLFQEALDEDLAPWPLYRGRLLLQYGVWLRRRRRISQSRMPLRTARDTLAAVGARLWSERAREELRASREKQHNGSERRLELTEQELQIAEMAAQGMSNREIGQRLYISPRTVGSHLYRVFPKLGVASRAQLSLVLDGRRPNAFAV